MDSISLPERGVRPIAPTARYTIEPFPVLLGAGMSESRWRAGLPNTRDRSGPELRDVLCRFATAVVLVHHARKSGATRPGQALRGGSELHACADSNLYLRRRDRQILMTVEHRAAPSLNDIEIELADYGNGPALRQRQVDAADAEPRPETPERRILQALADADTPLSQR